MYRRIAKQLLIHVFYRMSAVVIPGEARNVCCVWMFDTVYGAVPARLPQEAREIWLISNHPEGQTSPYAADIKNIKRIYCAVPKARVRLFICGEDIGCMEVAQEGE